MSGDPAVQAAQRAFARIENDELTYAPERAKDMIAAAREALAPIREMHRPFQRVDYPGADGRTVCNHCLGPTDWPCLTARLCYTTDELETP